jgi:hypothetical protein
MKKWYVYNNAGGIDDIKNRIIDAGHFYIDDVLDLFSLTYARAKQGCWGVSNLVIRYRTYDDRIDRHVYEMLGDHSGYKRQFVWYIICDEVTS